MASSLTSSAAYEPLNKYDHNKTPAYYLVGNEEEGRLGVPSSGAGQRRNSAQEFEDALQDRFDPNKKVSYKNSFYALLFIINLLVTISIGIYGVVNKNHNVANVDIHDSKHQGAEFASGLTGAHSPHIHADENNNVKIDGAEIVGHLGEMLIHKRDDIVNYFYSSGEFTQAKRDNLDTPDIFIIDDSDNLVTNLEARHLDAYPQHFKEAIDIANVAHLASKNGLHISYWIFGAVLSIATSFVISALFVFIFKKYAGPFVVAAYVIQVAMWLGLCIFSYVKRKYGLGTIFLLIFLVYMALSPQFIRRIPLSRVMISEVVTCITRFPSLYVATLVGAVVKLFILVIWGLSVAGIWVYADTHNLSTATKVCLFVYFSFSILWLSGTTDAVINMTVASVFAAFYHFGYESSLNTKRIVFPPYIQYPTLKSARHALTTSFGSACLGALVLSVVRIIKLFLSIIKPPSSGAVIQEYILSIYAFLFGTLEEIIQYFTHHIFVTIAIFGLDFHDAMIRTKELFQTKRGFDSVASDIVVHSTLTVCNLLIAILSGAISFGLSFLETAFEKNIDFTTKLYFSYYMVAVGFACSFIFSAVVTEVVHSGVCTTFICLVESPELVKERQPKLYASVRDAFDYIDLGN